MCWVGFVLCFFLGILFLLYTETVIRSRLMRSNLVRCLKMIFSVPIMFRELIERMSQKQIREIHIPGTEIGQDIGVRPLLPRIT